MTASHELSRRERQIMEVIYRHGTATARQVAEAMENPPSHTAVRTMLRILEDKGHLKHSVRGRAYVYQPTQPRTRAGRSALRRVVQTFFGGSLKDAVAAHLSSPGIKLDEAQLRDLADLIEQARRQGR